MSGSRPVYVTRKARFSAAVRHSNPAWSEERNRKVFGACANPFGHGHNYEVEVTVGGEVDRETGMVLNLKEIDAVLQEEVVSRMDHRHLNEELPEWRTRIPTTENLAIAIWERIEHRLSRQNARLHRVRVHESPDVYAEYLGEDV
ncbi:MAG TPA: 6-carboxytetrahydropterin synthase [Planctomycetota bacterium]|nr:6-carboxytetrahydropterin synthase [Planctomycetota bacterium]